MTGRAHTVVLGGGIAGLAAAWALAERGRRVTVLEREPALGTHSTARNAQIWLPVDDDLTTGPLARRTEARLGALLGEEGAWLRRADAMVLTDEGADASWVARGAAKGGLRAEPVEAGALSAAVEAPGTVAHRVRGAGILDPHAMTTAVAARCRDLGVTIRTGSGARAIEAGDAVRAVVLEDGTRLAADEVVNAAGAWAGPLGETAGAPVALVPLRRHLVVLEADPIAAGTTVWYFGEASVYFRPESGGVLASPCDEVPFDPCLPTADPAALELLADRLGPVAPSLIAAPVRTKWACLRTYAADRELVLGRDPRVRGLAWLAGLGGRGMTVAVGAGALLAEAMDGAEGPLLDATRPDRVIAPAPDWAD